MEYVIGIDIGTTSVKTILLSAEGNIVDEGNSPISDVVLCNQGNVTVTPIRLKVADHKYLSDVAGKEL